MGLALGIRTDRGLIQLLGGGWTDLFRDPAATVIAVKGTGRMGQTNPESFELTERRLVEQARRSEEMRKTLGFSPDARQTPSDVRTVAPAGSQPVRVGSGIRTPVKLVHVDAITPPGAQAAGVRGMVVLEVMIAADGSVTDAKVLRSIALLDAAAVAVVKQWKYSPTLLNGGPVPIIITVTVNFQ